MNNKIVKEVFIIVLLFIVIMFCLGILFYDSMSVNTKDIVSVKYQTSDSVNGVLTEIQDNSGVDVKKQTSNSILQSYSIDADDLKLYAEDNSYESGKKDPFAETSETIDERVTTTTKPGTATTSQSANPVKTDKVEDNKKQNTEEIKKLYAMRWGIETSFRELKYAVGLTSFHSKKREYITQEIWARLILYNFCEIITAHVVINKCTQKHVYQVNYTFAIHICRYFISKMAEKSPPDVEALISKEILPVRPERHVPRKVVHKKVVSFLYRVA